MANHTSDEWSLDYGVGPELKGAVGKGWDYMIDPESYEWMLDIYYKNDSSSCEGAAVNTSTIS